MASLLLTYNSINKTKASVLQVVVVQTYWGFIGVTRSVADVQADTQMELNYREEVSLLSQYGVMSDVITQHRIPELSPFPGIYYSW